ncbi:hypothetical protein [Streptomyces sp. CA-253872]|uniref:hypothetical protein n=1 Tax=Streptomyces sp. CA-253872 TaxID=3240067 RepID=UPI003D8B953F
MFTQLRRLAVLAALLVPLAACSTQPRHDLPRCPQATRTAHGDLVPPGPRPCQLDTPTTRRSATGTPGHSNPHAALPATKAPKGVQLQKPPSAPKPPTVRLHKTRK